MLKPAAAGPGDRAVACARWRRAPASASRSSCAGRARRRADARQRRRRRRPGPRGRLERADGRGPAGSDRWRLLATPVEHDLRGVVWTGERWIAVGDLGTILTRDRRRLVPPPGSRPPACAGSPRARAWSPPRARTGYRRHLDRRRGHLAGRRQRHRPRSSGAATAVGSELLLSGQESTVIRSADGVTWTPVPTFPAPTDSTAAPRPFLWQLAARRRATVVAVGDFGAILDGTLAAGLTAVPSPTDEILRGVASANGRWVAVGSGRQGPVLRRRPSTGASAARRRRSTCAASPGPGSRWVAVGDQSTVISSANGRPGAPR